MKLVRCIVVIIFTSMIPSKAQEQNNLDKIENEIVSYNDTDYEIVRKARKLIINVIINNNETKLKELVNYLFYKYNSSTTIAVWDIEKYLLAYWTEAYTVIFDSFQDFSVADTIDYQEKIYPPRDLLFTQLKKLSIQNYDNLLVRLDNYAGKIYQQEIFALFLDDILFDGSDSQFISTGELNKPSTNYLPSNSPSIFDNFIRTNIRAVFQPSQWDYGLNFFSGWGKIGGHLNSFFENSIAIGVTSMLPRAIFVYS